MKTFEHDLEKKYVQVKDWKNMTNSINKKVIKIDNLVES